MENIPFIPEFYKNKEIFITGGTGFIGKALIEKLLRSCPDIGNIYIVIRQKKSQSLNERLESLKSNIIFSKVLSANPKAFNKVIPIAGDVTELGLGISAVDLKKLENVSVIIHASASVRFDDPLRDAIFVNVRATRELLNIALGLKHLKVFMHISTAFCNCDHKIIEEKIYPAHLNWKTIIKMAETMDSYTLDILSPKIMDSLVNTYLFTKGLAENLCQDYQDKLPIVIYRPAIVTGSEVEPIAGWVDNLNGMIGLALANGLGVLRSLYCHKNAELHCTPVDTSVRGIIVAAWKKVVIDKGAEITIYNVSNGTTTITEMEEIGHKQYFEVAPPKLVLWYPAKMSTSCLVYDNICAVLVHFFPALLIDFVAMLTVKPKMQLLKIQRRIRHAQLALRHFVTHEWTIETENYKSLTSFIHSEDLLSFSVSSDAVQNRDQYIIDQMHCVRRYILNTPDEELAGSKAKIYILMVVDSLLRGLAWLFAVYYSYKLFFK